MGYIKEPKGIDLIISPMPPLSDDDRQMVSAVIAHYKKTGEILRDKKKVVEKTSQKKLIKRLKKPA